MEQQIIASNNISIYHYRNPHLHSFCLSLTVKAGVLYETRETNGITHFKKRLMEAARTLFTADNTLLTLKGDTRIIKTDKLRKLVRKLDSE